MTSLVGILSGSPRRGQASPPIPASDRLASPKRGVRSPPRSPYEPLPPPITVPTTPADRRTMDERDLSEYIKIHAPESTSPLMATLVLDKHISAYTLMNLSEDDIQESVTSGDRVVAEHLHDISLQLRGFQSQKRLRPLGLIIQDLAKAEVPVSPPSRSDDFDWTSSPIVRCGDLPPKSEVGPQQDRHSGLALETNQPTGPLRSISDLDELHGMNLTTSPSMLRRLRFASDADRRQPGPSTMAIRSPPATYISVSSQTDDEAGLSSPEVTLLRTPAVPRLEELQSDTDQDDAQQDDPHHDDARQDDAQQDDALQGDALDPTHHGQAGAVDEEQMETQDAGEENVGVDVTEEIREKHEQLHEQVEEESVRELTRKAERVTTDGKDDLVGVDVGDEDEGEGEGEEDGGEDEDEVEEEVEEEVADEDEDEDEGEDLDVDEVEVGDARKREEEDEGGVVGDDEADEDGEESDESDEEDVEVDEVEGGSYDESDSFAPIATTAVVPEEPHFQAISIQDDPAATEVADVLRQAGSTNNATIASDSSPVNPARLSDGLLVDLIRGESGGADAETVAKEGQDLITLTPGDDESAAHDPSKEAPSAVLIQEQEAEETVESAPALEAPTLKVNVAEDVLTDNSGGLTSDDEGVAKSDFSGRLTTSSEDEDGELLDYPSAEDLNAGNPATHPASLQPPKDDLLINFDGEVAIPAGTGEGLREFCQALDGIFFSSSLSSDDVDLQVGVNVSSPVSDTVSSAFPVGENAGGNAEDMDVPSCSSRLEASSTPEQQAEHLRDAPEAAVGTRSSSSLEIQWDPPRPFSLSEDPSISPHLLTRPLSSTQELADVSSQAPQQPTANIKHQRTRSLREERTLWSPLDSRRTQVVWPAARGRQRSSAGAADEDGSSAEHSPSPPRQSTDASRLGQNARTNSPGPSRRTRVESTMPGCMTPFRRPASRSPSRHWFGGVKNFTSRLFQG